MKKIIFIFSAVFFSCALPAQNVVIRGLANMAHKGKIVSVYSFDDFITYTRVKQATDTISQTGSFELGFDTDVPTKVEVRIDNLVGNMYVLPKYYYGITYPKADSLYDLNPNTDYLVDLGFIIQDKSDTNEINSLIIDFNRDYRKFFVQNYQYFVAKRKFQEKLDSFQLKCNIKYANVKEPFFKGWLNYSFAGINLNTLRNKAWLANRYLIHKPVLYDDYEYMSFFNSYFNRYLQEMATTKKGADIIDVLNENSSFQLLDQTMKKDPLLQNDTLRELVLIKELYAMYFVPDFKRENILQMLEQAGRETQNTRHKIIVDNILKVIYNLSPGSDAPAFTLLNRKGERVSLSDFKGKYVYLNFMASWCVPCLQELKEIADIKKKYGDKVVFISISLDEKEEEFKKFVDKNPKYDWQFLYFGSDKTVKERYNIKAMPTYFFISKEGKLVLSPAKTPRAGFELVLDKMFNPKKKGAKNNGPIREGGR
ncbi:MAG: TlpA family protein disulfide reductase [Bacteroidia bacterium]|nr:TlpA family protein disulfide reductase [Bacteroidia bacterium]